jgi:hypothetical protein
MYDVPASQDRILRKFIAIFRKLLLNAKDPRPRTLLWERASFCTRFRSNSDTNALRRILVSFLDNVYHGLRYVSRVTGLLRNGCHPSCKVLYPLSAGGLFLAPSDISGKGRTCFNAPSTPTQLLSSTRSPTTLIKF